MDDIFPPVELSEREQEGGLPGQAVLTKEERRAIHRKGEPMITIRRIIRILSPSLVAALAMAAPAISHPRAAVATALAAQHDQEPEGNPPRRENPRKEEKPEPKATKPQENRTDQEKPAPRQGKPEKNQERQRAPEPNRTPETGSEERAPAPRSQTTRQQKNAQPARAQYQFRSEDVPKLRQHFQARLRSVDRANRPQVVVGGYIPRQSVTYIEPVPVEVVEILPPVPEGYVVGYWDGYCIVYDPNTFLIIAVIDLL
jgi:hypothetical protein